MYDAIIVGARCAGSPTAMLLAQKGYKILLLDKAGFPSDTISTHSVWPPGTALLKKWNLLEKVKATKCPEMRELGFDVGPLAIKGSPPAWNGTSEFYAPRRTELDKILVDAAVEGGAELRENTAVEEILMDDSRVTGVRCKTAGGSSVTENARIVIGADGRHSIVAKKVDAPEYNVKPSLTCWYYSYWSGVDAGACYYSRPGRAFGTIPTNDGTTCVPVAWPNGEFAEFRSDIEGNFWKTLDIAPELAERVRAGKREERFYGIADVPNFFRKSYGDGWALVGDSGYHKDPITAQGISDAFRGAESLAEALDDAWSERTPIETALGEYEKKRDEEAMPMYEFTAQLASLEPPPPEMQQLFGALVNNQDDTDRFFGVITGTVPVQEFFAPDNIERMIGGGGRSAGEGT